MVRMLAASAVHYIDLHENYNPAETFEKRKWEEGGKKRANEVVCTKFSSLL